MTTCGRCTRILAASTDGNAATTATASHPIHVDGAGLSLVTAPGPPGAVDLGGGDLRRSVFVAYTAPRLRLCGRGPLRRAPQHDVEGVATRPQDGDDDGGRDERDVDLVAAPGGGGGDPVAERHRDHGHHHVAG